MKTRVVVFLILFNTSYFHQHVLGDKPLNSKMKIPKCCDGHEAVYRDSNRTLECKKYHGSMTNATNKHIIVTDKNHQNPIAESFTDIFEMDPSIKPKKSQLRNYEDKRRSVTIKQYLSEDGFLYLEYPNFFDRWKQINKTLYCVDYVVKNLSVDDSATTIYESVYIFSAKTDSRTPVSRFYTVAMSISSVFLLMVLIVYMLLPDLRNLAGKVLMAYVFSQLLAFLFLAILQIISSNIEVEVCVAMTTTTYFFLLASFCWMNVMSFDIWWTFRGYAKARPIHRRGETFKFLMYCIYGWGVPLLMAIAFKIISDADLRHMPWIVTPLIGVQGCFLEGGQKLVYLYAPMLILIANNWIFFLMTAFNIWRINRDTAVLDSPCDGLAPPHRQQRHRFCLYLKLSVVMGINWVLEVVSSESSDLKIWYITDAYNFLIGVFVFMIFVCKKKIFLKLKSRFSNMRSLQWCYQRNIQTGTKISNTSQDASIQISRNPKDICDVTKSSEAPVQKQTEILTKVSRFMKSKYK